MSKMFFKLGFGLLAAASLVYSSGAAVPLTKTLAGHVPAAVAHLRAQGQPAATNRLALAIGLPLRNAEGLTNLLKQLYDPASSNYQHYLTPEEFTAQFGPTEQDYQAVIDYAQQHGLTVTARHGNRMLVDVNGQVSDIENALHVKIRNYPHPTESRTFFAPDTEPTIDSDLSVLHVSGLDNYVVPRPMLKRTTVTPNGTPLARPAVGSAPGGGYIGSDFRNAYVPGSALTGAGQMVGLLQFDSGFYQSDITAYEAQAGITNNVPVQAVLLDGYGGGPGFGNIEVSLDIEMVIAMAPGISKILVFEGSLTDDILSAMASSNQVKQLSASWGYQTDATSEQLFKQFAAQGQSFFNASGDFDAWVGGVFPPSDDPYITIVGGTTLTTTVTNGPWTSEAVWNADPINGFGSGGGISLIYPIPTWQTNIIMTTNQGSTTMRNLPDVALTADNVYEICFGGFVVPDQGGTSAATPLWAAYMALVNQQRAANGNPSIGFINPTIYSLASGANYTNLFHDITTGSNSWSQSSNLFNAVAGYDLCTGLGTPNGTNLIYALAPPGSSNLVIQISPPAPPYGTTLSTLIGGNPNGIWTLFVMDDSPQDVGVISNGWYVTLTLANPVGLSANLNLTVAAPTNTVPIGSNVVYVIGVTNYGPSTSSNVVVFDSLPAGTTLVSSNYSVGSINFNGANLVWSVGTLITNAGAQLTLTVRPAGSGTIINSAIANANTPDPNPDDNFVSTSVLIGAVPAPQLSAIYSGSSHEFLLSVNNPSLSAYVVQASTNLVNWVPVYTNPGPLSASTIYTNSNTGTYPYRFFRVLTQ